MARFNALAGKLETPAEPPPKRKSRAKAALAPAPTPKVETELSRHIGRIPSATIAALLGDPDMTTAAARAQRDRFAAWCAERPHLQHWRAAWRLFETALAIGLAATTPEDFHREVTGGEESGETAAEIPSVFAGTLDCPLCGFRGRGHVHTSAPEPSAKIIQFPDSAARRFLASLR
jgi:hypothetical protein